MLLAIVGSTHLGWARQDAADVIRRYLRHWRPALVISGRAKGVDSLAAHLAWEEFGVPVCEFVPTVRAFHGPGGFAERNQRIADTCTHLLRIAWDGSTTYGSGWTRDRAKAQGKPTKEYSLP